MTVLSAFMSFTSTGSDAPVMLETAQPMRIDFFDEGTVYTSAPVVPIASDVAFLKL